MNRRFLFLGLVFVLALLGLALLKTCTTSPYKDKSLQELLVLYRAELDAPGLTVDEVADTLQSAKKALKFVRDEIVLSPYEGRQLSPDDVLLSRVANQLDKAVLLGALLEKQGWQVGYLNAGWAEAAPYVSPKKVNSKPSPILKEIAERIDFDLSSLDGEWEGLGQSLDKTRTKIAASVAEANQLLVDKTGYNPEYSTTTENPLGKRIILEGIRKGRKKRFDPVYFKVPFPESLADYDMPPLGEAGIELRLADGRGFEQTVLRWSGSIAGREIKLHFLPAMETAKTLAGPADPASISLWVPVLSINDQVQTGKPFSLSGNTPGLAMTTPIPDPQSFTLADPSRVSALQVASIETPDWPKVRLALKLVGDGDGIWVPTHFSITDNGQQVFPRLLNIDQSTKSVMILTDVSPSMKDIGAFEVSKEAIIGLVSNLSPIMPVGLTSFAGTPRSEVPLAPLGDGVAFAKAAQGLSMRDATGIYAGLDFVVKSTGLDNGVIVLLSDGVDNVGGNEEDIVKALKERNIRVFALALGADVDAKLLQRIARKTDGFFAKIRKAEELEPFYARLGSELTSYVMMEYDAPEEPLVPDNETLPTTISENTRLTGAVPGTANPVRVQLNGTDLVALGQYRIPQAPTQSEPPRLLLHIEMPVGEKVQQIDRLLIDLGEPEAPWALTGDYVLMNDLGGYGPDQFTSAYITEWIKALRQKAQKQYIESASLHPSFDQIQTVNGFRALSSLDGEGVGQPGSGPKLYLRRSTIRPGKPAPERRRIFDVLFRAQRGYQTSGTYWGLDTSQALNLEIAGAIAEGWIIGGKNGVDALLARQESLEVLKRGDVRPDWLAKPFRQIPLHEPDPGLTGVEDRLLVSPDAPDWAWQVDASSEHNFRTLYSGNNVLAKGASIEEIASQFDKIDKMYQIYEGAVGNLPGPYASTGALLSAIASMKRQENKLWCYSTVMMGYVGEAIGDDEALLNRDAQAAKSNAAKLCKIKGNPDDGEAFVRNAVLGAVKDGVNSWATNITKEGVGGMAADAHSAWGIGGAMTNAAALYRTNSSPSTSPVTPGFHRAMANTVIGDTTP